MRESARDRMRLILVGDGPLRTRVQEVAEARGVSDLVWFAGERADVSDVLRGLDCFVLPSRGEGVSNTILEAMAAGLPVIATDVGGNPELVQHGVTGSLVPRGDFAALGECLLAYFEHPLQGQEHGKAGRRRVEEHFTLHRMTEQYEQVYLQALRRTGRALVAAQNT